MNPKEKKKELVNKYLQVYDGRVEQAKKCALIAVEEIIEALEHNAWQNGAWIGYYNEVRKEIEKL